MKTAIESRVIAAKNKTGVGKYTENLIKQTIINNPHHKFEFITFGPSNKLGDWRTYRNVKINSIKWMPQKLYSLLLRTHLRLPFDIISRSSAEVFIFPAFVRWPLSRNRKSIIFVYDTSYIDTPEKMESYAFQQYLSKKVPHSVANCNHIITISNFTKSRLIQEYSLDPEKISVIYPAVDNRVFKRSKSEDIANTLTKLGINRKYFLYLGTLEPRKNIAGIIRAYSLLPSSIRSHYQLVLAGKKGWEAGEFEKELKNINSEEIILTGYVNDTDVAPLLSGCSIFLFPSFYEGWGMPVIEAMACGAPVITGNNSSLPEAGGDAALYVDVKNSQEIADSIKQIIEKEGVANRMIEKGYKHISNFSWETGAKKLTEVILRVAKE